MKTQHITVLCIYQEDGTRLEELLLASFRLYLKRASKQTASGGRR